MLKITQEILSGLSGSCNDFPCTEQKNEIARPEKVQITYAYCTQEKRREER